MSFMIYYSGGFDIIYISGVAFIAVTLVVVVGILGRILLRNLSKQSKFGVHNYTFSILEYILVISNKMKNYLYKFYKFKKTHQYVL